jgi:hypothetical protein
VTEELPPPLAPGEAVDLRADPMVLASGALVALGLILLVVGVVGSWHWKAAVWGAVLASLAAFALVAVSANQRRTEFPAEVDEADADEVSLDQVATVVPPPPAEPGVDSPPPRPRFPSVGKSRPGKTPPVEVRPPPPQPSNVQVMHVSGSNVRVSPTPAPMPISRPATPVSRPPSTPPATPPTIQVGVPRTPGFPTYQPVDPEAPVIQVRNRYHRPDCRYVSVADDAVPTTVGAARASNAMPCGVCRP